MTHLPLLSRRLVSAAIIPALFGCAAPVYTVDDGSPVDEKLLAGIRTYGKGHRAIRPAIVRSAALKDKDCSTQYELPFSAVSSYDLPRETKIAWARGLAVDERLTVIAAAPDSGLNPGDKIEELDGYSRRNTLKMVTELISLRDNGKPFDVKLAGGKVVNIAPVKVCRGYTLIAPPDAPDNQDYHWLQSIHALSLFTRDITPDEALWITLWTQGLSEEAGMRMKTYHYGVKLVKTGMTVASIASGVGAVANAANTAAAAAASQASRAATDAALQAAAKAAAEQAASKAREKVLDTLRKALTAQAQDIALDSVKAASLFKASLSGISWVASTGFSMADKWAFDRMQLLNADPVAPFTLHYKLASSGISQTALVLDEERLPLMTALAGEHGMEDRVELALEGENPDDSNALAGVRQRRKERIAAANRPPVIHVTVGDVTYSGAFALNPATGHYSGNGKISWQNGDVYEGDLDSGVKTGNGSMTWANGQAYAGDWRDDSPNGNGKLSFANGDKYEGAVRAGVPEGKGAIRFASGDEYKGEFRAGVPHGTGAFAWANGDRYEGQWENNLRHGHGLFVWKSGDSWEGAFLNGSQTEQGILKRHAATPTAVEDSSKTLAGKL